MSARTPTQKYCGVETDIMENYRQHTEGLMLCGNGFGGYGKRRRMARAFPFSVC
ncbi:MAG: hypothetical protein L6V93_20710 [Clostridiales bacterium]|nr:MAG: hypothetical protein L6V93_20710 [Clostridiales bacterium]